jgi:putative Holliday junction resolvase
MATAEYIMALDVGQKRIGVALAHQVARFARPLTTLEHTDHVIADIQQLVEREQVNLVLVGLPRGMDGGYTEQTRSAEAFKNTLSTALPVPVELADETLTSVQAETQLAGKQHTKADIDALAACYILEGYLTENPSSSQAASA